MHNAILAVCMSALSSRRDGVNEMRNAQREERTTRTAPGGMGGWLDDARNRRRGLKMDGLQRCTESPSWTSRVGDADGRSRWAMEGGHVGNCGGHEIEQRTVENVISTGDVNTKGTGQGSGGSDGPSKEYYSMGGICCALMRRRCECTERGVEMVRTSRMTI